VERRLCARCSSSDDRGMKISRPRNQQVDLNAPITVNRARRYASRLRRALAAAARRDTRRDPVLASLYRTAQVEGVDARLKMKKATVIFTEPPFSGGLYATYDWATLDELSDLELARSVSWSLRDDLRRALRR
jgi:hypothetical protein